MKYTRRHFLAVMGTATAGAGLAVDGLAKIGSIIGPRPEWYDKTERIVSSICRLCPGGCGLRVRAIDGIPVKIDGNPLYPVNHGALCPRGLAGLQSLYSPDRIKGPMARVGGRGSGNLKAISWDEAIEMLNEELVKLREAGSPEGLVILNGDSRGMLDRIWSRFAEAYGTPNYVKLNGGGSGGSDPVAWLMHGEDMMPAFDLGESAFVLSFGCDWLGPWNSPVYQMQAYGHMRRRDGRRGEIVHVEPRMSHSAAKADLWVPIKPGTEGILALGFAHMILREELYDSDYVSQSTFGFEDWVDSTGRSRRGFKREVLEDFPPSRVSELTGVSTSKIVEIARKFALTRPAVALDDNRSLLERHDLFTRVAVHSLNALVGSLGVRGGVVHEQQAPPLSSMPDVSLDDTARRGLAAERLDGAGAGERFLDRDSPHGLAEALSRKGQSAKALVLLNANPAYGRADKQLFRKALEAIPFVATVNGVLDETSDYADLILPEHHFLERWQGDEISHLPGFALFGLGTPAIKPLYDTRHAGDLAIGLASSIGGSVGEAFPWNSYEDVLRYAAKGLFESRRGYVVSTADYELLRRVLRKQGYKTSEFSDFDEFWRALVSRGAWWEPTELFDSPRRRFRTPSKRFEMCSRLLEDKLKTAAAAKSGGGATVAEEEKRILGALGAVGAPEEISLGGLLSNRAPREDEKFPFVLKTYELLSIGAGGAANLPWLQEDPATHVKATWESWVEIHPEPAGKLGVRSGDWVLVESPTASLRVRARIYSGTRPDVIAIPVGQGHTAGGRWAKGRGVDPSDLHAVSKGPDEGFGPMNLTRVRIKRA